MLRKQHALTAATASLLAWSAYAEDFPQISPLDVVNDTTTIEPTIITTSKTPTTSISNTSTKPPTTTLSTPVPTDAQTPEPTEMPTQPPTPEPTPSTTSTPPTTTLLRTTITPVPTTTTTPLPTEPLTPEPTLALTPEPTTTIETTTDPPLSVTTLPTMSQSTEMSKVSDSFSGAAIACIVVGSLVFICLVVIAIIRCRKPTKKRLSDKRNARQTQYSDGTGNLIELTSPRHRGMKNVSPVPVLSLRHYESDTHSTAKTDSIKTDPNSAFSMYTRQTSESIDSYQPSPHGEVYRNMASPTSTPMRSSHTFSDIYSPASRTNLRTSDFSINRSFSIHFNRPSSITTFGAMPSHLLRNSDDLSVYSDRSEGTF